MEHHFAHPLPSPYYYQSKEIFRCVLHLYSKYPAIVGQLLPDLTAQHPKSHLLSRSHEKPKFEKLIFFKLCKETTATFKLVISMFIFLR